MSYECIYAVSHMYIHPYVCRYEKYMTMPMCKYECAYLSMCMRVHIWYARMYLCELGWYMYVIM